MDQMTPRVNTCGKKTNKQRKTNHLPQTEKSFLIKLAVGNNLMSSKRANLSWGSLLSLADPKDTRIWEWKWFSLPTYRQFRVPFATFVHSISTLDFRVPASGFRLPASDFPFSCHAFFLADFLGKTFVVHYSRLHSCWLKDLRSV